MDIERLTARNKNGLAYLVNVKPDEQEVDSPYENTLKCILDCFERLAQYEEAEIARQSVTSEEVADAIDQMQYAREQDREFDDGTFVDSLDLAITALQAYQGWVSVNDRLPNNMPVVIYSQFGIGIGHYNPVLKTWIYYGKSSNCTVTHWKPLPEPPKGE